MGILYQIGGGQNELYLLGSIHVGFEEMYPFGENIQKALQESDTFVYECDTGSLTALFEMQNQARYHAGDGLKLHLSDETFALLEQLAAKYRLSMTQLSTWKPWAIVNSLMSYTLPVLVPECDAAACLKLGVENQVAEQAGGKNVLYLETIAEQLAALNGLSDELQEEMLAENCRLLLGEETPQGTDADMPLWGQWWRDGDAASFATSYRSEVGAEGSEEYRRILLTERNDLMAERIAELLEGSEKHCYFVTVGLMHLVLEEDSILSRLESAGYTVTQIR